MKKTTLFFILSLTAIQASAADLTVNVDTLRKERAYNRLVLRVSNTSATPYRTAFIACAFMQGDKAVEVVDTAVLNIPPKDEVFTEIIGAGIATEFDSVRCRVSNSRK
jgi:hypothetical protein